jgi:hypothetical protein
MSKRLNPLEKEFLIRRFKGNPNIRLDDICEVNNVSITSFKKWLEVYSAEGLEGLMKGKDRNGNDNPPVLPEGIERTEENYKREILKLRIENERLKKNYTVAQNENGEKVFIPLKEKNSPS